MAAVCFPLTGTLDPTLGAVARSFEGLLILGVICKRRRSVSSSFSIVTQTVCSQRQEFGHVCKKKPPQSKHLPSEPCEPITSRDPDSRLRDDPSITCADDGHALHVLEELRDGRVLAGVQGVAVYPQVELQPAGAGVKGHLMFSHSDVGDGRCLAVEFYVSEEGEATQRLTAGGTNTCPPLLSAVI